MPPSHHSSSSHSSHSHSSSHSSHSHSSSSHSSRSYSGSSHSYSSHSSRSYSAPKSYSYVPGGRGSIISRPLYNQPTGYNAREHGNVQPRHHYCKKHNYTFFPAPWTDAATGFSYRAGYYDESGAYYEDVAFKKGNKYENVLFECPYCGSRIHRAWEENTVAKCSSCGGEMRVLSFLDEYTQDPYYTLANERPTSSSPATNAAKAFAIGIIVSFSISFLTIIVTMLFIFNAMKTGYSREVSSGYDTYETDTRSTPASNVDIFGKEVYLDNKGDGAYEITDDESLSERKMKWDYGYDSYFEPDTECYLWYNTEVSPNLWQYWYEGISSDYGDYGWMEYEDGIWYIEASNGNWIELPDKYDTSGLWHIEE